MKYLNLTGLQYLATKMLNKFVAKETGKGLSTNDYTTAEKNKLAGVAANANKYVHPTTAGNKHIPAGGASGKILGWASAGTAQWQDAPSGGGTQAIFSGVSKLGTHTGDFTFSAGQELQMMADISADFVTTLSLNPSGSSGNFMLTKPGIYRVSVFNTSADYYTYTSRVRAIDFPGNSYCESAGGDNTQSHLIYASEEAVSDGMTDIAVLITISAIDGGQTTVYPEEWYLGIEYLGEL